MHSARILGRTHMAAGTVRQAHPSSESWIDHATSLAEDPCLPSIVRFNTSGRRTRLSEASANQLRRLAPHATSEEDSCVAEAPTLSSFLLQHTHTRFTLSLRHSFVATRQRHSLTSHSLQAQLRLPL